MLTLLVLLGLCLLSFTALSTVYFAFVFLVRAIHGDML